MSRRGGGYDGTADGQGAIAHTIPRGISRRGELRGAFTAKSAARAGDIAPIIADIKTTGATSLREIAAELNGRGIPTARGGEWSAVQVQRVMNRGARQRIPINKVLAYDFLQIVR